MAAKIGGKTMRYVGNHSRSLFVSALLTAGIFGSAGAAPSKALPDNMGGGLRQLVEAQTRTPSALSAASPIEARIMRDRQSRVLVNVWLDGRRPLSAVHQSLGALGANVTAELGQFRQGVIAAYIPVERASEAARLAGVRSIILEHKPTLRVGKATSQGVATINANKLNALGLRGQGITIAALSDSYDTAPNSATKIHAAQDIESGDLPGPGNPKGDTTPVVVLDEDPVAGTDEGRALLQIIYDIAPKSKLCFATAFTGEVQFAANILKLADRKGPCRADVIDDDVGYSEEPLFSDGVVALAVDQVKADGVAYFSSAGNGNSGNYRADFNRVADAAARSRDSGPLVLGNVPTELTAGGFHNFAQSGDVSIALPISAPPGDHFLVLQWDDPFFADEPTASYDFLVFDANGSYHPELSGVDNVYSTAQPVQGVSLPGGNAGANYYVAIALRPGNAPHYAKHLQILDFDDGNQVTLQKFFQRLAPSIIGHPNADGAIAVAADFWDNPAGTEYFSSLGPTAIYFDQDNRHLATPVIRRKPDIAAPDGVNTTFFGSPGVPGDPHPLFFGTSAAAPHAAAVGALLIQAAGGPHHLSPDRIKTLLTQTTQQPHQLDPGRVTASLKTGGDTLDIRVQGFLPLDPNQFHFTFKGAAGDSVSEIVMDSSAIEIAFGDRTDQFLKGFSSVPDKDILYLNKTDLNPVAKIVFANGAFKNGDFVNLGLDVDNSLVGFEGINSALLYGTKLRAVIMSGGKPVTVSGVLSAPTGKGYSVADGFGLIDAFAAYQALKAGH